MKFRKYAAIALAGAMCMSLLAGCGDKKEETPVVEEKEPELKTIGKEDKEALFEIAKKEAWPWYKE